MSNTLDIQITAIDKNLSFEEVSDFLPLISDDRRDKISVMKDDKAKVMSLMTEKLILEQASTILSLPINQLKVKKTEKGKPYLDGVKDFYFSVSHSDDIIVFCASNKPVGIDVEHKTGRYMDIARRFFTTDEYECLSSSTDKEREFLTLWTKKESYIKMIGEGLYCPLNSFDVTGDLKAAFTSREYTSKDGIRFIISTCEKL